MAWVRGEIDQAKWRTRSGYTFQIMYNTAYAYAQLGRKSDAHEQIEKALAMSEQSSENRHKIISSALEDLRVRFAGCLL